MSFVQGILLTGGKSSRMGQDKSLLRLGSTTFADRIIRSMKSVCDGVLIVGPSCVSSIQGVVQCPDMVKDKGPAGGIYTGLTCSSKDVNLVAGCDTPLLSPQLFREMVEAYDGEDVLYCRAAERDHPLIALYATSCKGAFLNCIESDMLKLSDILDKLNTRAFQVPENLIDELRNINTPYDYESISNENYR